MRAIGNLVGQVEGSSRDIAVPLGFGGFDATAAAAAAGGAKDEEAVKGRRVGVLFVLDVASLLLPLVGAALVLVSSSITRQISSRHAAATAGSNARFRRM
jgi:hypothetical protein